MKRNNQAEEGIVYLGGRKCFFTCKLIMEAQCSTVLRECTVMSSFEEYR